jgi:NADH:ubiquinone oxidoreductase subunit C
MFCLNFSSKGDIRNILLDYSRSEYPMLKEFPSEGFFDVYYDFFDDQLNFVESEFVEL